MVVDQRLRSLLVRYQGRIQFDYFGPRDVCSISARRDGSAAGERVYVSFSLLSPAGDPGAERRNQVTYGQAVTVLRRFLTMPQAQFDNEYPKNTN